MPPGHTVYFVTAFLVFLLKSGDFEVSSYVLPEPRIEVLSPRGVRVSIPDEDGLQLFGFHANINKRISRSDVGEISGTVYSSQDSRWTIEDSRTSLRDNDVLHYWIYAQVNGHAYRRQDQTFNINLRERQTDDRTEEPPINSQAQLVLDEQFDMLNESVWDREIKMPLSPDYEFCVYHNHNHEQLVTIKSGILRIKPQLLEDAYGENATVIGTFELAGCTSPMRAECSRHAVSFSILPPVVSARLTTKAHFGFRYGKIEIRAKFPEGDWLYPEMWLEPRYSTFGSNGSGRVLLGLARANEHLVDADDASKIYDSRRLEFGLRTITDGEVREELVERVRENGPRWTKDFHVYTTTWAENGFTFSVDGQEVGRLSPGSSGWLKRNANNAARKAAPFDQEFAIVLGVGAGGLRVFPDNTISSGNPKPWRNIDAKAMLKFWQKKDRWLSTWHRGRLEKTALEVDYIRVWSHSSN